MGREKELENERKGERILFPPLSYFLGGELSVAPGLGIHGYINRNKSTT